MIEESQSWRKHWCCLHRVSGHGEPWRIAHVDNECIDRNESIMRVTATLTPRIASRLAQPAAVRAVTDGGCVAQTLFDRDGSDGNRISGWS